MSLVDLGKKLLESARLGETENVQLLMTNGAPFTTDWLGTSPLHMAAQYGHLETAAVLLRAGISRDARTKVERTPLHIAAQEGHLDIVELLIQHCAEIDARDMLKMTPLHWAVERAHYHVVRMLLKKGADMNAVSKFGKTPLSIAEDNIEKEIIALLKQHAANAISDSSPPKQYGRNVQKGQESISSNATLSSLAKKPVPLIIKTTVPQKTPTETLVASVSDIPSISEAITSATTGNTKASVHKPVFVQANLANRQKAAVANSKSVSSSDSEEGESTEQNCTNVLATLAALAEATAPNATISTSEALQWLEMNGITMLPTDNSTIIASALEGGQTISLTEAGKLALTWVKEHQNLNNNVTSESLSSAANESSEKTVTTTAATTANQKLITIVTDQSQIPSIITSQQTPIVVLSSQNVPMSDDDCPPVKKLKPARKESPKVISNGNINMDLSAEDEKLKLQKELEALRKQAEEYKAQLLQKEHEAELYRKELEQIRTLPKVEQ